MKTILPLLALALASTLAAKAQLITVNFDAPGGLGSTNYAGAGADTGGVTSEYWNPITFDGTTSADLTSNGVSTTGITFSDDSPNYFPFGPSTSIPLFNPYLLNQTDAAVTETLNNVGAGTYDLYIYSQNGGFANRGGTFTLNGDATPQSVENAGDQSTFIAGTNYTEFTGITLSSPGSISFTWGTASDEGDLNGVQLVEVADAPEPATSAMLFGGVGLLVVARLRRLARL